MMLNTQKLLTTGLTLVTLVAISALLASIAPNHLISHVHLIAGAVIALAGTAVGIHRCRRGPGRFDPFHPLVIPLLYVAVSFLVPTWSLLIEDANLTGFTEADLAPNTSFLMLVGVVSIMLGLSSEWTPLSSSSAPEVRFDVRFHALVARVLLLLALVQAVRTWAGGGVLVRGIGQTTHDWDSSFGAFTLIFAPLAITILMGMRSDVTNRPLARWGDYALIGGIVAMNAINGNRGQILIVGMVVLYSLTRTKVRAGQFLLLLLGFLTLLIFVSNYRTAVRAGNQTRFELDAAVEDLSVAAYTTGVTAALVPKYLPFADGSTYFAAIVRQLPSPLANALFGPPLDTGNQAFRDMIGFTDPNHGFGYSLPAEGYLNYGIAGLVVSCFLFGLFLSWAHAKQNWPVATVVHLLYPITLAAMPMLLRSDALGAVKSILYPMVGAGMLHILAHLLWARGSDLKSKLR